MIEKRKNKLSKLMKKKKKKKDEQVSEQMPIIARKADGTSHRAKI